ncbi:MAG: GldM family protein [Bacteroidota bacterium]|nr:GldM family protein [Bacteroidota bacterium]
MKTQVIQTTSDTSVAEANYTLRSENPSKKGGKWLLIGIIALLGVCTGVYFIFLNKKKGADMSKDKKTFENNSATIQLDKMNVLYTGIDNPITINTNNVDDDKVTVNINGGGGSLTKVAPGKWMVKVNSISDNCSISVYVDGKMVRISDYKVRPLPNPVATVGNIMSNESVAASQFKAQSGVETYVVDFPYELKYEMISYLLTTDDENGDINTVACNRNSWSSAALDLIRSLTPGRIVTIDNIMVRGPDNTIRKIPGLVYYIK